LTRGAVGCAARLAWNAANASAGTRHRGWPVGFEATLKACSSPARIQSWTFSGFTFSASAISATL
jgi:hypothetical protein